MAIATALIADARVPKVLKHPDAEAAGLDTLSGGSDITEPQRARWALGYDFVDRYPVRVLPEESFTEVFVRGVGGFVVTRPPNWFVAFVACRLRVGVNVAFVACRLD